MVWLKASSTVTTFSISFAPMEMYSRLVYTQLNTSPCWVNNMVCVGLRDGVLYLEPTCTEVVCFI